MSEKEDHSQQEQDDEYDDAMLDPNAYSWSGEGEESKNDKNGSENDDGNADDGSDDEEDSYEMTPEQVFI